VSQPHVVEFFEGYEVGDWVWCLHCERCYKVGEYRAVPLPREDRTGALREIQLCPYQDCDGSAVLDAILWSRFREGRERLYPDEPERNTVYPQYDEPFGVA